MPILHWLSRDDDIRAASAVPYRLLEEISELGYGDRDAGNMLIQGDNLDALKALLPFYSGQVKCICIDPPYNTRSAFEHYDDNLEHTKWLAMMWPRLELLRDLLAEEGSIWVSRRWRRTLSKSSDGRDLREEELHRQRHLAKEILTSKRRARVERKSRSHPCVRERHQTVFAQ